MKKHIKKILKMKVEDAVFSEEKVVSYLAICIDEIVNALELIEEKLQTFPVLMKIQLTELDFFNFIQTIHSSKALRNKSLSKFLDENDLLDEAKDNMVYHISNFKRNNVSIKEIYGEFLNQIVLETIVLAFIKDLEEFSESLKCLSRKALKEQLIKLIAFFYNYNLLNIVPKDDDKKVINLINKIKNNCYETKVISSSYEDREKPHNQNDNTSFDISNLINNCMKKTKYVYREPELKGKHLSHKNPIPHIRRGHHKTLRNGKTTYIKSTLVNYEEATPSLIHKFEQILDYEEKYLNSNERVA